jgi:hypothetical protein
MLTDAGFRTMKSRNLRSNKTLLHRNYRFSAGLTFTTEKKNHTNNPSSPSNFFRCFALSTSLLLINLRETPDKFQSGILFAFEQLSYIQ